MAGTSDATGDLTAAEEAVLAYVRDGAMDAEIAVRLGSSIADVKGKVASIVSKADVADRAALRKWRPVARTSAAVDIPHPMSPPVREPLSARRALAPLFLTLLAAAGAASLVGVVALRGGSDEHPASSSTVVPAARPAPTTAPRVVATSVNGATLTPLRTVSPGIDFPTGIALIVKDPACPVCLDPGSISRLYRSGDGELRRDVLFRPPPDSGQRITGIISNSDGSHLAVSILSAAPNAQPVTTVSVSRDGGVTWAEIGTASGTYEAVAFRGDMVLVAARRSDSTTSYALLPGSTPFAPPTGSAGSPLAGYTDGQLMWRDPRRPTILRDDGSLLMTVLAASGAYISTLAPDPDGNAFVVEAIANFPQNPAPYHYLFVVDRAGQLLAGYTGSAGPIAAVYAPGLAIGMSTVDPDFLPNGTGGAPGVRVPAIVDLRRGVVTPILHPFINDAPHDPYFVVAVTAGPFARVISDGECVPLYFQPAALPTGGCLAARVLVRHLGAPHTVTGADWYNVTTPSGESAWMDGSFLEIAGT